ncbi:MAG: TlyA family RNA methyltransferase [Elusimicrobiota bacterium]
MIKKRLDVRCVEIGLFDSRQKAKAAIMAGDVMVNGVRVYDASYSVKETDKIEIYQNLCPYVSRGGLKLKAAIDFFKIDLKGKICLDVGVATGGFSDCMIKEGAKLVYGVDVGKGQVHERILKDPLFVFMPDTNARYLKPDMFNPKPEFAAVDVSFISLKLILPPLKNCMEKKFEWVLLIKPQFELSPKDLRKGIVKTEELRLKALKDIENFVIGLGLKIIGVIDCPVKGAKGNKEFLMKVEN